MAILAGVAVFSYIDGRQHEERTRAELVGQLRTIQAKLEGAFNSRLFLEKGIISFVITRQGERPNAPITQEELENFCQQFMPDLLGIRNISLVQNFVITHAYPYVGNEKAIGTDLSKIPEQREAILRVASGRRSVLAGPVQLVQGGTGIVHRTPIFWRPPGEEELSYWGQSSLVLMQEALFAEAGLLAEQTHLDIAVRGQDGAGSGGAIFWGEAKVFAREPVSILVTVPGGYWEMAAVPTGGWQQRSPFFFWIWGVGGVLAGCGGLLVWLLLRTRETKAYLRDSEEQFRQMFHQQQTMMWLVDPETLQIIMANRAAQEFYGYPVAELQMLRVVALAGAVAAELEEKYARHYADVSQRPCIEVPHRLANGEVREVEVRTTLIRLQERDFFFDVVQDVTERKRAEAQLRYMSLHDSLTGLYNRAFFERELQRCQEQRAGSVGLIFCDVDGLKLVNDTLGHEYGDVLLQKAATILTRCLEPADVIARIGGDEFAVLRRKTTADELQAACESVRRELANYNSTEQGIYMSLSLGFATAEGETDLRALYKDADYNMYREKMHRGQSARSAIVQTVMKLLAARDFITEGHADRMQDMAVALGRAVGVAEGKLADLRLLAQFHDIGKVGIPDRILLKPGPLDDEEREEMKRHCEIGHRIAQASPDLEPIADWILKHQEWWNGSGYPLGIRGEEIPLACRILAVVDAYDAMTSDRPYRKAMSREAALEELDRGAGMQFDPALVPVFKSLARSDFSD